MDEEAVSDARERAIRLLARREHSAAELRIKLRQRAVDAGVIDHVLAGLESENLLSDERFAEEFVRSRRGGRYGPVRIRAELGQRGVDEAIADALLRDDEADYLAQAVALRSKRFGDTPPTDVRERQRQYRYLANRGFTTDQIRHALGLTEED